MVAAALKPACPDPKYFPWSIVNGQSSIVNEIPSPMPDNFNIFDT
jgi:hypothetical protein